MSVKIFRGMGPPSRQVTAAKAGGLTTGADFAFAETAPVLTLAWVALVVEVEVVAA